MLSPYSSNARLAKAGANVRLDWLKAKYILSTRNASARVFSGPALPAAFRARSAQAVCEIISGPKDHSDPRESFCVRLKLPSEFCNRRRYAVAAALMDSLDELDATSAKMARDVLTESSDAAQTCFVQSGSEQFSRHWEYPRKPPPEPCIDSSLFITPLKFRSLRSAAPAYVSRARLGISASDHE